jgi:hypothetical protein
MLREHCDIPPDILIWFDFASYQLWGERERGGENC